MDKISNSVNMDIPKGASDLVDKVGKEILNKYGSDKLKDIAKEHNVPIVENKPLARMLYYNVEIDADVIPELPEFYKSFYVKKNEPT